MKVFPTLYGAKPRVSRAFAYEVEAAGVEPAKGSPRFSRARDSVSGQALRGLKR
jgi:hypothetical protein